jgi:hypothetical protein
MAGKLGPIIPLAAAGLGLALLVRGGKGKTSGKDTLSESARGEILAGLPDSADIIYENGQIILGQHFVEDNFMAYVNQLPALFSGPTTAAQTYIEAAKFIDRDSVGEPQIRPLRDLKSIDEPAYTELTDALIALSKAHYELKKAEESTEPHDWASWWHKHRSVSRGVKETAKEGGSISNYIVAQIEKLKAEAQ